MGARPRLAAALCALGVAAAAPAHTAYRLRTMYLDSPINIDVVAPRFSYALSHPDRGSVQSAYEIVVSTAPPAGGPAPAVVWDSGRVASNKTLNIPYAGSPLASDTDYSWTVTWWDGAGAASAPATGTFSTALMTPDAWHGAAWVSSPVNGSLNTYRAEFSVPGSAPVVRARAYLLGLGYHKAWINGARTDDFELGTFTTFERRVLYEALDVTALVRPGPNALGVMLGHGWWSQPSVKAGPRQLIALLSVTTADGTTTYYPSTLAAGATKAGAAAVVPLVFSATAGPVLADDIYEGETFSGPVAAALGGWAQPGYAPGPGVAWVPAVAPVVSPATYGSVVSAHPLPIRTDRTFAVAPGGISQPGPGVYVFDFGQNMAGQTTLTVHDCPPGTVITVQHGEILYPNGSVHDNYSNAPMRANYTCAGGGTETYRTMFTYYGFRYAQLAGYPGVPGEDALAAHFVHSDVPQTGEFSSSSPLLNAIQHATRYASWSNLMDVPTDCPQRERRGWLGDAQLSFETVIHNIDGGAFYNKWIQDFVDTQVYDNATMGADMALPDCVPFYGHGHTEADPGWGIAGWFIPSLYAAYYDDDSFEADYYPHMRAYMEHWIKLASGNNGVLPINWWGDWANYIPGPYAFKTPEYPQVWYIFALDSTSDFAARVGQPGDAAHYAGLAAAARAAYLAAYYNATTGCFTGNCTYVSQVFGLSLGLLPKGSAAEAAAWARAVDWFGPDATHGLANHTGAGIISLKYLYPLLDRFGMTGQGLRMQLQTDRAPSFGYWITQQGATTLWEAWDLTSTSGGASYSHIMFGGTGSWYYTTLAGLGRAPGSRSWQSLAIAPPADDDTLSQLTWASASVDSPMGLAAAAWTAPPAGEAGAVCGTAAEKDTLTLTCNHAHADATFDAVAFASFGTPGGSCAAGLAVNASCNAPSSTSVVAAACVGKPACSLPATVAAFGGTDPCYDVVKRLSVALTGSRCAAPLYTLSVTVPAGGSATVRVPTRGAGPARATVTEGGTPVWAGGAFRPGAVPGVTSGAAAPDGSGVVLTVGSGTYAFAAVAA